MSFKNCKSCKLLLATFSILVIIPMAMNQHEEGSNNHVSESWGFTDVKISRTKFTWSISNLKFCCQKVGDVLKSPTFSSNDGCKWFIQINPKGVNDESKDYLSMYLHSVNCNGSTMVQTSILNVKGEQTNIKTFTHEYERGKSWGYNKYILRTDLLKDSNELLSDNKLTVTCDITAQVSTENFLRQLPLPKHFLVKDFGYLLDHHVLTDVTLICEEKEFEAHKAILAVRSPVFKARFDEKTGKRNDTTVEITDVDYKTLAEMLRYIYTEQVFDLENFASTLVAAAEKYKLPGLKTLCENNLRENLSAENAIDFFILGDKYGAYELKNEAKKFIASHISQISNTTEFKSLVRTQPKLAIETFDLIS